MPNGKPGDHPINDIVDHGLEVFTPEIDALILEISKLLSRERMWEMFNWFSPPPDEEFRKQLFEVVEHLRKEARDRGWE